MPLAEQLVLPNDFYGKSIAILGYSKEGREFAKMLREHEISVVIGLRPIDDLWTEAERDGFHVKNLWDAVESADIIQVW